MANSVTLFIEIATETENGRSGHDGGISRCPNKSVGSGGSQKLMMMTGSSVWKEQNPECG
jgi:hypothetical protein